MLKTFHSSRVNELNSAKTYCSMSAVLTLFPTTDIAYDSHKISCNSFSNECEYSSAFSQGSGFAGVFPYWNLTRVNLTNRTVRAD